MTFYPVFLFCIDSFQVQPDPLPVVKKKGI